jgi:hypothetical protein
VIRAPSAAYASTSLCGFEEDEANLFAAVRRFLAQWHTGPPRFSSGEVDPVRALIVRELAAQIPRYAGKSKATRALARVGALRVSNTYHSNYQYDQCDVAHSPPRKIGQGDIHRYDALSTTTLVTERNPIRLTISPADHIGPRRVGIATRDASRNEEIGSVQRYSIDRHGPDRPFRTLFRRSATVASS